MSSSIAVTGRLIEDLESTEDTIHQMTQRLQDEIENRGEEQRVEEEWKLRRDETEGNPGWIGSHKN